MGGGGWGATPQITKPQSTMSVEPPWTTQETTLKRPECPGREGEGRNTQFIAGGGGGGGDDPTIHLTTDCSTGRAPLDTPRNNTQASQKLRVGGSRQKHPAFSRGGGGGGATPQTTEPQSTVPVEPPWTTQETTLKRPDRSGWEAEGRNTQFLAGGGGGGMTPQSTQPLSAVSVEPPWAPQVTTLK